MISPNVVEVAQHPEPTRSQEQKCDGGVGQAEEPVSEIKAGFKTAKGVHLRSTIRGWNKNGRSFTACVHV